MKKKILTTLAFSITLLITILFFQKRIENSKKINIEKIEYKQQNPQLISIIPNKKILEIDTCDNAFRFEIIDSSIFYFTENRTIRKEINTFSKYTTYDFKRVMAAFKTSDTLLLYSDGSQKICYLKVNEVLSTKNLNVAYGNIVVNNNNFFYLDTLTPSDSKRPHYILKKGNENIIDINKIIKPYLQNVDDDYLAPYTDGWLYTYSSDTICYMFEKIDLLLLINTTDNQIRTLTTSAKYKYIPMKGLEVKDPISGSTIRRYESTISQEYIHSSICVNSKLLLIKSDFPYFMQNKEPCELINIYSKHNHTYLGSIPFILKDINETILWIRCTEDTLYILTSLRKLYSTVIKNE